MAIVVIRPRSSWKSFTACRYQGPRPGQRDHHQRPAGPGGPARHRREATKNDCAAGGTDPQTAGGRPPLAPRIGIVRASRLDSQEPPAPAERLEVVEASTPASAPEGKNRTQVRKSGVIVNFASNVVQLSAAESDDSNTKLKRFAPLSASQKWRIHVVTPKGFSEATRLAFLPRERGAQRAAQGRRSGR